MAFSLTPSAAGQALTFYAGPKDFDTLAAIDRLVHHATIFEINVDSYRRKAALKKAAGPGRPPARATIKTSS